MDLRNKVCGIGYATCFPSFVGTIGAIMEGEGRLASEYFDEQAAEYKTTTIPADNAMFEKCIAGML